ncbi:response regulator [Actinomadura hibisca]|uniref:response regulator n=1 Tax=Actinomadura hibisca TaxID=68565 RepID=UPI000B0A050F|nr:response regulator [Actinomadura hibisca]
MPEPTVLVIEDEQDVRNLLAHYFQGFGCVVRTADTGEEGMTLATDDPPDLVVLDVRLPGVDGRQVARLLRADPRTQAIRLVITSVLDQEDLADIDADGILAKPFRRDDVRLLVDALQGKG